MCKEKDFYERGATITSWKGRDEVLKEKIGLGYAAGVSTFIEWTR
jgi:hypothetical protein